MKGFLQFFMQRLGYMDGKKASQCFKILNGIFVIYTDIKTTFLKANAKSCVT